MDSLEGAHRETRDTAPAAAGLEGLVPPNRKVRSSFTRAAVTDNDSIVHPRDRRRKYMRSRTCRSTYPGTIARGVLRHGYYPAYDFRRDERILPTQLTPRGLCITRCGCDTVDSRRNRFGRSLRCSSRLRSWIVRRHARSTMRSRFWTGWSSSGCCRRWTGRGRVVRVTLPFRRFCRLESGGGVPDATTRGRFRSRLVKHDLWELLLGEVNRQLEAQRIAMTEGRIDIVDAAPAEAARSGRGKRKDGAAVRDPEAGLHARTDIRGRMKAPMATRSALGLTRMGSSTPGRRRQATSTTTGSATGCR